GLLAVVLVASGGRAEAGTPEVCMTPDMIASPGEVILCTLRNAFAYGTMEVVSLEVVDAHGTTVAGLIGGSLPPLTSTVPPLGHEVGAADNQPFSCRFTVVEAVPGYVRATISRLSPLGIDTPGYPAQCNPF